MLIASAFKTSPSDFMGRVGLGVETQGAFTMPMMIDLSIQFLSAWNSKV
jgi:hypothetical protein